MAREVLIAVLFWGGALVVALVGGHVFRRGFGRFKTNSEGDNEAPQPQVPETEVGSSK